MSTPLTRVQREALALALRTRQLALEVQLAARQHGQSRAEQALTSREEDGDDALQLASEREIETSLSEIDRRELLALTGALRRVHEPDFGLCADCGKGIPFQRLHVEPQALRCVACESAHEKKVSQG